MIQPPNRSRCSLRTTNTAGLAVNQHQVARTSLSVDRITTHLGHQTLMTADATGPFFGRARAEDQSSFHQPFEVLKLLPSSPMSWTRQRVLLLLHDAEINGTRCLVRDSMSTAIRDKDAHTVSVLLPLGYQRQPSASPHRALPNWTAPGCRLECGDLSPLWL